MTDPCPKCNEPKSGATCPKCGLVFAKFDPSVLEDAASSGLKQLWQTVEQDWDNAACHATFVETALARGEGGFAAGCYRRRLDDPMAQKQLEHIALRLSQMIECSSSRNQLGRLKAFRFAAILFLIVVCVALATLFIVYFPEKQ